MLKDLSRLRVTLARGTPAAIGASGPPRVEREPWPGWLSFGFFCWREPRPRPETRVCLGRWFAECRAPEQPRCNARVRKLVFSNGSTIDT